MVVANATRMAEFSPGCSWSTKSERTGSRVVSSWKTDLQRRVKNLYLAIIAWRYLVIIPNSYCMPLQITACQKRYTTNSISKSSHEGKWFSYTQNKVQSFDCNMVQYIATTLPFYLKMILELVPVIVILWKYWIIAQLYSNVIWGTAIQNGTTPVPLLCLLFSWWLI